MTKTEKPLDPLRKSNEEEYFRKQNANLAAKLKGRLDMQKAGVKDDALSEALIEAGFDKDSVRALFIVPLLEVAWADDEIQPEERDEVLKVLKERGIEKGSRAFDLVSRWLSEGRENSLYLRAKTLVEPLLGHTESNATWILEASKRVAEATGGLFGLGIGIKTSIAEEKIIRKIAERLKK
jgi:hypothetical protein